MSALTHTFIAVSTILLVACVPISPEPPTPIPTQATTINCNSYTGAQVFPVGQTATDPMDVTLLGFIDFLGVASVLKDETVTVTFNLREFPKEITFKRENVSRYSSDYGWIVQIDIDGLPTQYESFDYWLGVFPNNWPDFFEAIVMKLDHTNSALERVDSETAFTVSHDDHSITVTGEIPGITNESFLEFSTFVYLQDGYIVGDAIECEPKTVYTPRP